MAKMDIFPLEETAYKLAEIDTAYWTYNQTGSLEPIKNLIHDPSYNEILLKRFHVSSTDELLQFMLLQNEFPEYREKLSPTKPLFVFSCNSIPGNDVFGAEIFYVLKGTFRYSDNNTEMTFHEGRSYLVSPIFHRCAGEREDCVGIGIVMTPQFLSGTLFSSMPQDNIISSYFSRCLYVDYNSDNVIEFDTTGNDTLRYYMLTLLREFTEGYIFSEKTIATLPVLIVYELLRTRVGHYRDQSADAHNGRQILDVIQFIQKNCRTVTLQETAEHYHFNPSYLSKLIKKLTGQTFLEIIHTAKMDQARTLLLNTTLSVTEVAHEVGYSNVNHFYRLFFREYSCTPSEYRHRNSGEPLFNQH